MVTVVEIVVLPLHQEQLGFMLLDKMVQPVAEEAKEELHLPV